MPSVQAKLYSIAPSHPAHAARLMLEYKGIDHQVFDAIPGMHAIVVRAAGFPRGTVPALKLDGERIQGSREISRALERARPEPPLFPADPEQLLAVEDAERWGEQEFQDAPRLLTRWLAGNRPEMRVEMARAAGIPAARVVGPLNAPVARYFARKVGADDTERVRTTLARLPAQLDRVDGLIAAGVIGDDQPNAADFQIAPTVRALMAFADLAPLFEARPCVELATRLLPRFPGGVRAGMVPAELLSALPGRQGPSR